MPWISRWKPALFAASLHNAFATSGRGLLTATESRRVLSSMAHTRWGVLPAAVSNAHPRARSCPSTRLNSSMRPDRRVEGTHLGVAFGADLSCCLGSTKGTLLPKELQAASAKAPIICPLLLGHRE